MSTFLQNLNGHKLCSIDLETSGRDPRKHDILQVAIIPLTDDLVPDKKIIPFVTELRPNRPENADPTAMRINRMKLADLQVRGVDQDWAADYLVEWWEKLNLGYEKRIAPLGCNWPFDRAFLLEWLGPATFEMCFDALHRDVQVAALYCNDRAGWIGNDFPYPKLNLAYLCSHLKIERRQAHDALDDARVTAEVYRRIVKEFL